MELKYKRIT